MGEDRGKSRRMVTNGAIGVVLTLIDAVIELDEFQNPLRITKG